MADNNDLRDWMQTLLNECSDREIKTHIADEGISLETMSTFNIPPISGLGLMLSMSGGFSVGQGRLRMLGSSSKETGVRSLLEWNKSIGQDLSQSYLLIADDIYGNFYAINVGVSDKFRPGEIIASYADNRDWESASESFVDFFSYYLSGDLSTIFSSFETGDFDLEQKVADTSDCVINFYPPLFTKEGSVTGSSKAMVPAKEELELRSQILGMNA